MAMNNWIELVSFLDAVGDSSDVVSVGTLLSTTSPSSSFGAFTRTLISLFPLLDPYSLRLIEPVLTTDRLVSCASRSENTPRVSVTATDMGTPEFAATRCV